MPLGRKTLRILISLTVIFISAVSTRIAIHTWRDPEGMMTEVIYRMQDIVSDDKMMTELIGWTESPEAALTWADRLWRTRRVDEITIAAYEQARALAPDDPTVVLHQAYALATDADCNGRKLLRLYEQMCGSAASCPEPARAAEVGERLNWCRRPNPGEDPATLSQTVVGSLKSCQDDYLNNSDAAAYAHCSARAESGDGGAAYDLGLLHIYGYGVDRDHTRAVTWFERGTELGHADSKAMLGSVLYSGRWVKKDAERGWRLMEEAAAAGSTNAMVTLAQHHRNGQAYGHTSHPDNDTARRWLSRAAEQGHPIARELMSRYYPEPDHTAEQ